MVAVGGYKDVQCKEVGVVVDLLCVTDLAEMNFVACWKILASIMCLVYQIVI